MDTLLNHDTAQSIIDRIKALTPECQAQWGIMNSGQMVAHCRAAVQSFFDTRKVKRPFISYVVGPIAKRKLLSDKPWPRSLPTAKYFIFPDTVAFEKERTSLINWIERFVAEGAVHASPKHPFFGKMTNSDWGIQQYKHLDHHLTQFGV